ncbi:MAG: methyltransferase domain-containing protein [Gammaproteobacteria bacterium]|nr:methyltransferase domain-containing protein [Gammaproteobacteria bacterium]
MDQNALCALDAWFLTPQGEAVADAFVEHLTQVSSLLLRMRGEVLLQVGACGRNAWLDLFGYREKWVVSPTSVIQSHLPIHVYGGPKKLPFDQGSVDCVIAPLVLETMNWSSHPLDELDRVLKPMGYAVIFSVNALSLWGLAMRMGALTCYGNIKGRPVSIFRLKHALLHRGYDLTYLSPFYYIPPVKQAWLIQHLEILNELGKMISPCPGGFYCMIVQKYVPNILKPIKKDTRWRCAAVNPSLQPI